MKTTSSYQVVLKINRPESSLLKVKYVSLCLKWLIYSGGSTDWLLHGMWEQRERWGLDEMLVVHRL